MIDINAIKLEPKININFNRSNKSVAILNKGRNNKFINNKIQGFDIGILDEGENTLAEGNEIK